MALPEWVDEVAGRLDNTEHLVFVEGRQLLDEFGSYRDVVLLAEWSTYQMTPDSARIEIKPIAIVLDADLSQSIEIGGDANIYPVNRSEDEQPAHG